MRNHEYRLGLDLGTNSLGWCVYRLDEEGAPAGILRMGARIFSDGRDRKSLASLAATRRQARQARRRRDRVLKRRERLLQALIASGLMPADEAERKRLQGEDPYMLRMQGLDAPLTLHQLGRALYHLCRKRGFRSSRKDRGVAEAADARERQKETGKIEGAVAALKSRIAAAGCRTVGEYLAREHAQRKPVRARRNQQGEYALYLQREMVKDEFERLWAAQQAHHPHVLSHELRERLMDILLFQRRLRPVLPGRCLFEEDEYRLPLCSPLQQRFRILQELNNLRVKEGVGYRPLALKERDAMRDLLYTTAKTVTFAQLAKAAGLGRASAFNLESDKRKGLKGDLVAAQFSAPAALGDAWHALAVDTQEALAALVERAEHEEPLIQALLRLPEDLEPAKDILRPQDFESHWLLALRQAPRVTERQAETLARIVLPEDYGSLGRAALMRILPELEREVATYDVAVQRAGYAHHSQLHTGEIFERLPYYGAVLRGHTSPMPSAQNEDERRFGRIPNPTVHIGLNQLRQLVNALIRRYGPPREIVVELTREFGLSGERRRKIENEQADNQRRNEALDAALVSMGLPPNRDNRLRLRLWSELTADDALDGVCLYTGERMTKAMVFGAEVEVDHILPFSRTLHDGIGNKVLCLTRANRDKGNRTPHEAFATSPGGYRWDEILERVERHYAHSANPAVRRKAELFRADALDVHLGGSDFLDRQLHDTAYLSRAARQYLSYVCHKDRVWSANGRLTALMRGRWGLNRLLHGDGQKNRNDHRHHALDAAVVALCDRSTIQRIATAAARAEARGEQRALETLALPWLGYREALRDTLERVVVSHKPDHGREAALHNDTNYALRGSPDKTGNPLVGRRVPLEGLRSATDVEALAEGAVREELLALLRPLSAQKDIRAALQAYSERTGVRRVMKEERMSVIAIHDRRTGAPYRYVKGDGNYCYDIVRLPNGRWGGEVVDSYRANRWSQAEYLTPPKFDRDGRPLVMRLRKGDTLACELDGERRLLRVAKFSEGMIALVDPREADVDGRTRRKELRYIFKAPSTLQAVAARLVGVDILGYVNDPGFAP